MLSVEECLERLVDLTHIPVKDRYGKLHEIKDSWDSRFLRDVFSHSSSGKSISTAQGAVVLKLIRRYDNMLVLNGLSQTAIDTLIATPYYRIPPHQSTELPREVRWLGNRKLAFRYKFNAGIQEDIKKLKSINHFSESHFPIFNRNHKIWIVEVNASNHLKVMDFIRRHNFHFDDNVTEFFMRITNSKNQPSSIETLKNEIRVTVCDDDLLNEWLSGIKEIEGV